MGMFEKRRFKKFLVWAQNFDPNNASTWDGMDPSKTNMQQVYEKFGLDENTADFTGHSLALFRDDQYVFSAVSVNYEITSFLLLSIRRISFSFSSIEPKSMEQRHSS